MLMSITSSTFTTHTSLGMGGIFYINTLKSLTLTSVTATNFYAPYSATGGGRFLYFTGDTAFTLTTTASTF